MRDTLTAYARAVRTAERDAVMGVPMRKGLGYFLDGPPFPVGGLEAFGHPGHGGSLGFADPAHRFAFGLTKNRIVTGPPSTQVAYRIAREARAALGLPTAYSTAAAPDPY